MVRIEWRSHVPLPGEGRAAGRGTEALGVRLGFDCRPPKGDRWLHEVKFDRYRPVAQGRQRRCDLLPQWVDFTSRFPAIAYALKDLATKTFIIDAEAVPCNAKGMSDFVALHGRGAEPEDICCWAFDLLRHNSLDTRPLPLIARRAKQAQGRGIPFRKIRLGEGQDEGLEGSK